MLTIIEKKGVFPVELRLELLMVNSYNGTGSNLSDFTSQIFESISGHCETTANCRVKKCESKESNAKQCNNTSQMAIDRDCQQS